MVWEAEHCEQCFAKLQGRGAVPVVVPYAEQVLFGQDLRVRSSIESFQRGRRGVRLRSSWSSRKRVDGSRGC